MPIPAGRHTTPAAKQIEWMKIEQHQSRPRDGARQAPPGLSRTGRHGVGHASRLGEWVSKRLRLGLRGAGGDCWLPCRDEGLHLALEATDPQRLCVDLLPLRLDQLLLLLHCLDERGDQVGGTQRQRALGVRPQKGGSAPVALSGIARCKVDASFGAIAPGDLLVSAPTPGHAMRDVAPLPGTVVGKALEPLTAGQGVIRVLVMLR